MNNLFSKIKQFLTVKLANQQANSIKIFLVDDQLEFLMLMEQYIINQIRKGNLNTNAEIEIFKFEHAKDAINSLSLKPNIIFLDYLLGVNETGLDFYYKVKPLLPNTDIIFLSGVEDTAALRAVTDNGQNKFIAKDNNMFSKVFETLKEKVNNFHLM